MRMHLKIAALAIAFGLGQPLVAMADATMVRGEVMKVDAEAGKITIKHEAIKKFDMDAMTMVFKAGDEAMVKQVKAGDRIIFHPDKVNGQITVTKIEMAK